MSTQRTITGNTKAWITRDDVSHDDLMGTPAHALDSLSFYSRDMSKQGWMLVGTAEITVTLLESDDRLIESRVAALYSQLQSVRFEAEETARLLLKQIQALQSLNHNKR
ncbi:MAG TPA: hypothetical protein VLD59_08170 [Steroidobacteraceae bacterium]|nr:hypothetical protein [Steroidobacteraceae bacterium]